MTRLKSTVKANYSGAQSLAHFNEAIRRDNSFVFSDDIFRWIRSTKPAIKNLRKRQEANEKLHFKQKFG
jgi:hypothetical protein